MRERLAFLLVLLLLLAGGGLVFLSGAEDRDVSLSAVLEIWGDVLRDVDRFGLQLTRVSDAEEMRVGHELAAQVPFTEERTGAWPGYVAAVGEALTRHAHRPGIRYRFRVVRSAAVNAFALPGGQVYVTTGMLGFLKSESELAAILGHEVAHVDLRHCIDRHQHEAKLRKIGIGQLGQAVDIARGLIAMGYGKYEELEADAQGMRMSIEAGYDPAAGITLFQRLRQLRAEPEP